MLTACSLLAQAQTQAPKDGGGLSDFQMLIPMIVIVVLFYVLMIAPMKRREKQQRTELYTNLKKNDEVLTSAGIIGTVVLIKDDEVTLKIDDASNAKMRVLKSSLVRIMNPTKDAAANAANLKAGASSAK